MGTDIDLRVITTTTGEEYVVVDSDQVDGRPCVALVELSVFQAAMAALPNEAPGMPCVLWRERQGGTLIPLDADTQRHLSDRSTKKVLDWAEL